MEIHKFEILHNNWPIRNILLKIYRKQLFFYRVCTFCNHLYSFEPNGISDKQIDAEKSYKNYDKTLSSIINIKKH